MDENDEQSQRERAMHQRLRSQKQHRHIVHNIMSWCQDNKFYSLSPLATSNLRSYMHHKEAPRVSWPSVRWFLRQIQGLTGALHTIHIHLEQRQYENLGPQLTRVRTGYHHDLKPENILVFEQRRAINPIFKISDLGAGKFTDSDENKVSQKASKARGTDSYFGPEWDNPTSRPFDIWAMACVLTELLIWFIRNGELEGFHEGRKLDSKNTPGGTFDYYWYNTDKGKELKPVVTRHLAEIETQCNDSHHPSPAVSGLKELPCLIRECFEINPLRRPKAGDLYERVDRMYKMAEVAEEEFEVPSTPGGSRHSQDDRRTV